jgi:F-type H+-transporting ATPase subunit gamma
MPSLKDIRRRIASVKNTQQVTKAMKMVSAAKLRRAQESIQANRPYAQRTGAILRSLAARVDQEAHPLLHVREPKRVMLVVVTSDRGLCGGFNANINRRAHRFLDEDAKAFDDCTLALVGRKGSDYFKRRQKPVQHEFKDVFADLSVDKSRAISQTLIDEFVGDELDAIYVIYNEFKSAVTQTVTVERLLPIEPAELPEGDFGVEHLYEPGKAELLDHVLPRHVQAQIWRILLESTASEHGARMSAMDSATRNAGELMEKLTLDMNRARQAMITKELLEIVAGAEALTS